LSMILMTLYHPSYVNYYFSIDFLINFQMKEREQRGLVIFYGMFVE
jgi:hypothetical protein